MGLDPEIGGEDALDNDGNSRAPYTRPPHDGTYAVAQDGVSPSVYVVFPIILATNDCGLVGNAYTSQTLGVPEHQLSTYQQGLGTTAFNPADLGCPGPDPGKIDPYELENETNQGAPSVLLPADLTALDPAWKSCVLGGLDLGRDPPRAPRPASNMAPKAASHESASIDPKRRVSSFNAKNTGSGFDTIQPANENRIFESLSVCSLVPRPQIQPSTPAESPPSRLAAAGIRPRNNAPDLAPAKTTPLPSFVGAYISATSYAGVVDPILAWVSKMQTLASLGSLPPVAPSNPYLALPKHRAAKRSQTSSPVTQSRSSADRSTHLISDPAAEASLVKASASSAADLSGPNPLSQELRQVQLLFCVYIPLPPAPSDPKAAGNGSSPYEPCGPGNLELAAATTPDMQTAFPPRRENQAVSRLGLPQVLLDMVPHRWNIPRARVI